MFDAYTVKKVLPRLLIAVVLIQLSWFIFTGMITLTNNVAYGVEGLIYAPIVAITDNKQVPGLGEVVELVVGNGTSAPPVPVGPGPITTQDTTLQEGALFGAIAAGATAAVFFNLGGLLALAGTVVLALFVGFFVLVLRQVVILGLLVIGPVALVAWILPGTEKWWKLWWESFSKLLIMYPMILGMIAAGRVFGYLGATSGEASAGDSVVKLLIVCIGFFGPFFLIPKTFQLAGSAFGTLTGIVNDRNKGLFDRLRNARQNGNKTRNQRTADRFTGYRARQYQKRKDASGTAGGLLGKQGNKALARMIGGYNIESKMSDVRARRDKELRDQIAMGRDEEIRALSVDKNAAMAAAEEMGHVFAKTAADGSQSWYSRGKDGVERQIDQETANAALTRMGKNGQREFKTLGGAWVKETDVDIAKKRWGNDTAAIQTSVSYEMQKATTDTDRQGITERYSSLANSFGLDDIDKAGVWKGAGYQNQGVDLSWKHTSADGVLNKENFVQELFQAKGSYNIAQMRGSTIDSLRSVLMDADSTQAQKEMAAGVLDSFKQQTAQMGSQGEGGDAVPIPAGVPGATGERMYVPGAAQVSQKIEELHRDYQATLPQADRGAGVTGAGLPRRPGGGTP